MPDALITTTELAVHNNWADNTYPTDRALQAIEHATGMIQGETGQRFVTVANDTVTLQGGRPHVWLPERPVTAVGAVTTTTAQGVVTARTLNVEYTIWGARLSWLSGADWPGLVTVIYSHGWAPSVTGATEQPFPEQLKWVCCSAASRLHDNPQYLRQQTIGGVSQTWAGSAGDVGPGLTDSERVALMPFRALVLA